MNISGMIFGVMCILMASVASAEAGSEIGSKVITNKVGQSFEIKEFSNGVKRSKYAVMYNGVPFWYEQDGSANAGAGESGMHTSSKQWCRVRNLYGDNVRVPECWSSYMYSSHLITGLNGQHYELWFSPSSTSYFKIRNQETNIWYAHDGSANNGRVHTSKEDWCRIIAYHGNGIIKAPEECAETVKRITAAAAGNATPAETDLELQAVRGLMDLPKSTVYEAAGEGVSGSAGNAAAKALGRTKGSFSGGAVGAGIVVGYGTNRVKDLLDLKAKNANAGAIAAETLTTAAVNTSITTMIMVAAGSSFNPVSMGVGFLVAGGVAGAEALVKASKDTSIDMEAGYEKHPRYSRDLNGITPSKVPQLNLPGTPYYKSGTLIATHGNPKVFVLDGKGRKRWITSPAAAQQCGMNLAKINWLEPLKFASFPEGEVINGRPCMSKVDQAWLSKRNGESCPAVCARAKKNTGVRMAAISTGLSKLKNEYYICGVFVNNNEGRRPGFNVEPDSSTCYYTNGGKMNYSRNFMCLCEQARE